MIFSWSCWGTDERVFLPNDRFREFQQFVTHKEFTTENLLFTIWFRSYRRRFSELEESERLKVDAPSDRLGDTLSPFGYLNKSAGGRRKTLLALVRGDSGTSSSMGSGLGHGGEGGSTEQRERSGSIPLRSMLKRVGSIAGKGGEGRVGPSPMPHVLTTGSASTTFSPPTSPRLFGGQGLPRYAPSPPPPTHLALSVGVPSSAYLPTIDPRDQPMRKEAQRAFDTFLRPGSARELNVTDEMRTRCRIALESSTHPDVVSEIYFCFTRKNCLDGKCHLLSLISSCLSTRRSTDSWRFRLCLISYHTHRAT